MSAWHGGCRAGSAGWGTHRYWELHFPKGAAGAPQVLPGHLAYGVLSCETQVRWFSWKEEELAPSLPGKGKRLVAGTGLRPGVGPGMGPRALHGSVAGRQFSKTHRFPSPALVCLAPRMPASQRRLWHKQSCTEPRNPQGEPGDFPVLVRGALGTPGRPSQVPAQEAWRKGLLWGTESPQACVL